MHSKIELQSAAVKAGDYQLKGDWDWTPFQATGVLHLRPLSDFKTTKLDPNSQNVLLAHSGKVPITVRGDDFEFTNKVEMEKVGDEFAMPEACAFSVAQGSTSRSARIHGRTD